MRFLILDTDIFLDIFIPLLAAGLVVVFPAAEALCARPPLARGVAGAARVDVLGPAGARAHRPVAHNLNKYFCYIMKYFF